MKIIIAVLCGLVLALTVVTATELHSEDHQLSALRRSETTTARQSALYNHQITALQNNVASLLGEVSNPVDPLSAFTEVCDQQVQNQSTGITQMYWYPCTNQAQTIPQPGN